MEQPAAFKSLVKTNLQASRVMMDKFLTSLVKPSQAMQGYV